LPGNGIEHIEIRGRMDPEQSVPRGGLRLPDVRRLGFACADQHLPEARGPFRMMWPRVVGEAGGGGKKGNYRDGLLLRSSTMRAELGPTPASASV